MSFIPNQKDISPGYAQLDEELALKHFLGKNKNEAAELFFNHSELYGDDLMWMGSRAFSYYFPSVEPYLRSDFSNKDSVFIDALMRTLEQRLQDDPSSIKLCKDSALRILEYIANNVTKFITYKNESAEALTILSHIHSKISSL